MAAQIQLVDSLRAHRTLQRCRRVLHQNLSVVDDRDAVAKLVGLLHVVRGQHDGNALLAQASHRLPHRDAALRIEPRARLVEKENLRVMRNGARDLNALRQTARKLCRIGVGSLRQMELRQQPRPSAA